MPYFHDLVPLMLRPRESEPLLRLLQGQAFVRFQLRDDALHRRRVYLWWLSCAEGALGAL